jgi:2-polyprenyl-3-methyl-5-hydroxy-6-metoxy-1,4-benzoquinol methylase
MRTSDPWLLARAEAFARRLPGANRMAPYVNRAVEIGRRLRAAAPPFAVPPPTPMPRFRALLAARYGIPDLDAERRSLERMYLDFALSTVARGEAAVRVIARHARIDGARYLDAGCAYGGFLVAFRRAGAREVVGVDVNPDLLDYARAVLADHGIAAQVELRDLLDPATPAALGRFDLITANDVIEHVVDPRIGLERLVALLAPGGRLYLEIPNRFWPPFLRSDGHYQLFGICALPKRLADEYSRRLRGQEQDVTYRQLGFYLRHLHRLGVRAQVLGGDGRDDAALLPVIARDFYECLETAARIRLPADAMPLGDDARRRIGRVAGAFRRLQDRHAALARTEPPRAARLARRLVLAFGEGFWRVLVERPASTVR